MRIQAMAARSRGEELIPWTYEQAALGPFDCLLRVLACGLCSSDLHMVDNHWGMSRYPLVPEAAEPDDSNLLGLLTGGHAGGAQGRVYRDPSAEERAGRAGREVGGDGKTKAAVRDHLFRKAAVAISEQRLISLVAAVLSPAQTIVALEAG